MVDIFSKVSGLFYSVRKFMVFFLSSFLTYYATKFLVDDLMGKSRKTGGQSFVPRNKRYETELWRFWDTPVTPQNVAGYEHQKALPPGGGYH